MRKNFNLILLTLAILTPLLKANELTVKFIHFEGQEETEVALVELNPEEDNRNKMRAVLKQLRAVLLAKFKRTKNQKSEKGTVSY